MVKSIISIICVLALIIAVAIYENNFVTRQFEELDVLLAVLYEKTETETANKDDVLAVQQNWVEKKKYFHIFIPHNEVKEIDLWLSEAVALVEKEKWEDALSKIEVLRELVEQIPNTFELRLENVF